MTFVNDALSPVAVQTRQCQGCSYYNLTKSLPVNENASFAFSTRYDTSFRIINLIPGEASLRCDDTRPDELFDGINYTFTISNCTIDHPPGTPHWLPLAVAAGIYAIIITIGYFLGILWNRWKNSQRQTLMTFAEISASLSTSSRHQSRSIAIGGDEDNELNSPVTSPRDIFFQSQKRVSRRVRSLDALRGVAVVLMIFVNYGGGGYSFFQFSPWFGLTVADVIFPSFVFIMGFSIVLSIKGQLMMNKDFLLVVVNVLKRTFTLFLLGFLLNTWYSDICTVRLTGELQRISISYLIVTVTHLTTIYLSTKCQNLTDVRSILIYVPEVTVQALMLFLYIFFTFSPFKSGDCPIGYQGPGGLHEDSSHFTCTGGMARIIDEWVFNTTHGNHFNTHVKGAEKLYGFVEPFDPEGVLGYTTSILLTEIGLICGRIFLPTRPYYEKLAILSIVAITCAIVGLILHSTETIFIVKNLWSLSFILTSTSITLVAFILLYLVIDVLETWPNGIPFHFAGRNSLLLYIAHKILEPYFPFSYELANSSDHSSLLFRSLTSTNLWLFIAAYFYYRKWFFTL